MVIALLAMCFYTVGVSAPNTPGTVVEEKFETRLESPKDMHFFVRWPKTAGAVKGMLCYCTYRDAPADLLKQMQGAAQEKGNPAEDYLKFADEQGLILMTWTLGAGFWDKSVSADEMEKARAKFYDKVFDDVANVWEQSLRSLIRKYDLPKSNYLLCGHSRGAQWAHRVALRYPAYFKAVSITVNTSGGRLVKMTYDKANQLVSSERVEATPPSLGFHGKKGELTEFTYDKAGRMTREKSETLNLKPSTATYTYGYLDKVLKVDRDGQSAQFHYGADGMLLGKTKNGHTESWTWDGLALLSRGDETYVNEPHITGGVPIIASRPKLKQTALGATKAEGDEADEILLSDYLGTSLDTLDSEETTSSLSPPPSSLGSTGLLTSYGSSPETSNLEPLGLRVNPTMPISEPTCSRSVTTAATPEAGPPLIPADSPMGRTNITTRPWQRQGLIRWGWK